MILWEGSSEEMIRSLTSDRFQETTHILAPCALFNRKEGPETELLFFVGVDLFPQILTHFKKWKFLGFNHYFFSGFWIPTFV